MIFDCDSTDVFSKSTNISLVSKEGKYLQGKGSFGRVSPVVSMGTGVFDQEVDISAYKNGSVHISLYVSDPTKMKKEIWLELSSSETQDKDEISWVIPRSVIKAGWNEFYLSIPKAYKTGEADLTKINFYRMFEVNPRYGVTIYYDNVYATNTPGEIYKPDLPAVEPDDYKESSSPYGKMIMSCNTVNILKGISNAKVTVKKDQHVEGTGAFVCDFETGASSFALNNATDLSAYEDGYIHMSLYINDVSLITKRLVFEMTSSGTYDKDEMTFIINQSELKSGWNHLWIPLKSVAATIGNPNLKSIDYLRIYADKAEKGIVAYLDDLYATMEGKKDEFSETDVPYPKGKMIASCNTINVFKELKSAQVTTKQGEFVEGTGAMKSTSTGSTLFEGVLAKPVDLTEFASGYLHYSIYLNKPSKCGKNLVLELTSAGVCDKDEYAFVLNTKNLVKGWNEIFIPISKAQKKQNPDLSKINYVRIYHDNYKEKDTGLVAIVDNICMTDKAYDSFAETQAVNGQMIVSGNTQNIFTRLDNAKVTTVPRQFVEGTGALISTNKGNMAGWRDVPVDISAYNNGYIHVSYYMNDVSLLKGNIVMELSSSDTADTDEYHLVAEKANLKSGWNEVYMPLNDSKIARHDGLSQNPNLKAIKRFRIYVSGGAEDGLVFIADNIHATMDPTIQNSCACGNPIYSGDIALGNCMCNFKTAFNMKLTKECKEGDNALQAKNAQAGIYAVLKNAVDISDCKDGYIHLRIYVDDVKNLKNNISFEISSSGTYDNNEYAWEIKKSSLSSGWNEIQLSLSKAAVTGSPDLKAINYFRLYSAKPDSELVLILDDVYAMGN